MEPDALTQPDKEARTWAMAGHAAGPLAILFSGGFLGFAVPLVIWLVKRDEDEFIGDQAKEALNFQITLLVIYLVLLAFGLLTLGLGFLLAIPAFLVLVAVEIVLGLVAALRSYDGVRYRYPFNWRLL
jgi:hypothetical protein